jgi:hypothetical protein
MACNTLDVLEYHGTTPIFLLFLLSCFLLFSLSFLRAARFLLSPLFFVQRARPFGMVQALWHGPGPLACTVARTIKIYKSPQVNARMGASISSNAARLVLHGDADGACSHVVRRRLPHAVRPAHKSPLVQGVENVWREFSGHAHLELAALDVVHQLE